MNPLHHTLHNKNRSVDFLGCYVANDPVGVICVKKLVFINPVYAY
jgi:hypothetical protein